MTHKNKSSTALKRLTVYLTNIIAPKEDCERKENKSKNSKREFSGREIQIYLVMVLKGFLRFSNSHSFTLPHLLSTQYFKD